MIKNVWRARLEEHAKQYFIKIFSDLNVYFLSIASATAPKIGIVIKRTQ